MIQTNIWTIREYRWGLKKINLSTYIDSNQKGSWPRQWSLNSWILRTHGPRPVMYLVGGYTIMHWTGAPNCVTHVHKKPVNRTIFIVDIFYSNEFQRHCVGNQKIYNVLCSKHQNYIPIPRFEIDFAFYRA